MRTLSDSVVVITGAASGFGRELARTLAPRGTTLVLADVDVDGGQAVAQEVSGTFVRCDVSSLDDNVSLISAAETAHGRVDAVFLNAGIATGTELGEGFDPELYRRAMGVNLDGVVFGAQAALPALRRAGGGHILATASLAGLVGMPADPMYTANKHGVVGFVRGLAPSVAHQGIKVNAVCPGFADTKIVDPMREAIAGFGVPLMKPGRVAGAAVSIFEGEGTGECWFVQPGRPAAPFVFRNVPGPGTDAE